MTPVRTLPALPAHRQALLALWNEAFPGEDGYGAQFLGRTLGRSYALVAEDSAGTLVGMAFGFDLGAGPETYRYLYGLAVARRRRGEGIGRTLLRRFELDARTAGCAGVLAVVMPDGPWNFYARCGYAACLRRKARTEPVRDASRGVCYPPVFRELAAVCGEPEVSRWQRAGLSEGERYGVMRRFDGTVPPVPPFLDHTLE